jgi:hypothetical protein
MRHPALLNVPRLVLYLTACFVCGLIVVACEAGLIRVPATVWWCEGLIYAFVWGGLTYLLWFVVRFSGIVPSDGVSRTSLLNRRGLLLIVTLLWAGLGVALESLLFPTYYHAFLPTLPLKIVLGVALFGAVIRTYVAWMESEETEAEETLVPASAPTSAVEKNTATETSSTSETKSGPMEVITIKSGQQIHRIQASEIHYIQADGDYVHIYTSQGRFLKEQTMKYFEDNLDSRDFLRIHRSCIVRLDNISRIELYEKQQYRVRLKDGQTLKASQAGYRMLREALRL